MKTKTQEKFDKIINEGFQNILKPFGFKKKGNNFYLQLDGLGQIINIQKSKWSTKDEISFTINTGVFVPEYWSVFYNYQNAEIPKFPTEPVCLIRKRIGEIRKQNDTWYDLKNNTDENIIIEEMKTNVRTFVLPYFENINTKGKLILELEKGNLLVSPSLSKMLVFAELNELDKAKTEYKMLINEQNNPNFLIRVREYGIKYNLV